MASPYIGEIRIFAGNFAPAGWAFCDGTIQSIAINNTLFNLIGTTYGGDGQQTFALPNLLGRVPVHIGTGFVLGQLAGNETVTLTINQIPVHSHIPAANSVGNSDSPAGNVWAATSGNFKPYGPGPDNAVINAASIAFSGGSQPHDNMIPFQVINYIISLYGVFPTQN
jgi:microcystin-dependent protein